jgi:glycosyltransferase involved in cell wall biosynthesis
MKRYSKWIIGIILITGFSIGSIFPLKKIKRIARKTYATFQQKNNSATPDLTIAYPITEKKPFVFVIASYNNESICIKNLQSVFDQTYDHYRVIYIDDCSTDKTYERVRDYIEYRGMSDRVTLIRNETRKLKLPNLYKAYSMCADHEIIACLDGDDWLAHDHVLENVNRYYQNPDVWMTYGSSIIYPKYERISGNAIPPKILDGGSIRAHRDFYISMLRTFYAGLFRQIKLKDLLYQGDFLPNSEDLQLMFSMIEMAPKHVLFIPDILYVINDENPINNYKVLNRLQDHITEYILRLPNYKPLPTTFIPTNLQYESFCKPLPMVILSEDNPLFLNTSLSSYLSNISNISSITVVYTASNEDFNHAYEKLKNAYPEVKFLRNVGETNVVLEDQLRIEMKEENPYFVLGTDLISLTHEIDLFDCLKEMKRTQTKSFILSNQYCPNQTI